MPAVTKSYMAKKEEVRPDWYVVDADEQIVGRLAVRIATILMGKHKPEYTPHVDCGDYVVVVNVERLRFGGKSLQHPEHPYFTTKLQRKIYDKYTGYPGGYKITRGLQMWQKNPGKILEEAVRRMLPKNQLGDHMLRKLKTYRGAEHPHQAQQPKELPEHLRA